MNKLIIQIKRDFPEVITRQDEKNAWLPDKKTVLFDKNSRSNNQDLSFLHELAHALLEHKSYQSDIELVVKEAEAWDKARALAKKYGVGFDEEHVENCLDTYRDWLISRSKCAVCQLCTFQSDIKHYRCFNCNNVWAVSAQRFCRTYRLNKVRSVK